MDSLNYPCSRRGLVGAGLVAGAALAAAPLAARAAGGHGPVEAAPTPDAALAAANLAFAFRLQGAVMGNGTPSNLLLSPLSVSIALAMVINGARGSTRQAIASALDLGAMTTADLNLANAGLLAALPARDPKVQLEIADSLWQRQDLALLPDFVAAVKKAYGAVPTRLNFSDPGAPAVINAWVSKHTHGLIAKIIDQIPPEMVLFLVNALYFKGPWAAPFDPSATAPGPFTLQGGSVVKVPMMTQAGRFAYTRQPAYEAISLPYGSGRFSMYLFLPAVSSSLRSWLSGLTARSWTGMLAGLSPQRGTISMPKFNLHYTATLNSALSTLGMGIAFDAQRADFSAMSRGPRLSISEVRHAAVMQVDEQGTKAAAVTSVGIRATA
ncbi:MAG TPA: serpin family protein, partial [Chloroflexota bacterium]|nr:serpin family protein [Chloroflexota bacterium]